MYAPDAPQMHVIDHCKGEQPRGKQGLGIWLYTYNIKRYFLLFTMHKNIVLYCAFRNVLVESARIARGKISPLSSLKAADYNSVVFPGGFGAAKNL